MIKTQLKPCESLLYNWIKLRIDGNYHFNFDVHNFKAWTGEFLDQSASLSEIHAALSHLNQMNLITVNGTDIFLKNYLNSSEVKLSKSSIFFQNRYNKKLIFWTMMITLSLMITWFYFLTF